ncbi:hypothetical protein OBBRIDRAFT_799172 [Obba rivulosa]|uniref:Uncharacterized protein n=1 Tax=Obba rivulosa TaxID=1052685 RepID=A0A8E2AHM8_9APHY|nr:hypothetical protein OBBRIDRAFT_799172 [Obba rivulosa]
MEGLAVSPSEAGQSSVPDAVHSFLVYPFATDADYQQGLQGILASGGLDGKLPAEQSEILLRSEVFYFNWKTGCSVTVDDVRDRVLPRTLIPSTAAAAATESSGACEPAAAAQSEPRELSFAELKALIQQGKTDQIPNNKVIPDELSTEPPSESKAAAKKKPWE